MICSHHIGSNGIVFLFVPQVLPCAVTSVRALCCLYAWFLARYEQSMPLRMAWSCLHVILRKFDICTYVTASVSAWLKCHDVDCGCSCGVSCKEAERPVAVRDASDCD